jgi:hypothetical protein
MDYRALNAVTIRQLWPTPWIDTILSSFHGACHFTVIDLNAAFHQIAFTTECDSELAAFITMDGHYQMKSMPFGLTNAPAVMQRLIAQLQDANFVPLIRYLRDGSIPYRVKPVRWRAKTDEFCLQAGILYRKVKHQDQFYLAIVVPLQLQRYILGLFHNNALSANFSSRKMIARLTSRFWWSRMATDCEEQLPRLQIAQKCGRPSRRMPGLLPQALRPRVGDA